MSAVKSGLHLFLFCWSPGALVLIVGLWPLLATGQVDPVGWAWPAIPAFALAGILSGRSARWPLAWGLVGLGLAVLLLCREASGYWPMGGRMETLLLSASLALGGGLLLRARRVLALAMLAGGPLVLWLVQVPSVTPIAGARPVLAVMSALPLFWQEGAQGPEARVDAPIITLLRSRFDVRPIDDALALARGKPARLLLAQPRALAPAELVAVDAWVRDGGQALLLVDPLLRWPSALPWGDRRRAPSVSLLGPLLAHWGVRLAAPTQGGEERRLLSDGRLLTLLAASRFESEGSSCWSESDGLILHCAIGRGRVVLVADADLIDDRLWLADLARPGESATWVADTPQLVARWLGADLPGTRYWVKSGADLVRAVRWAMIIGTGWAILGMALILAAMGRFSRAGHRVENPLRPTDNG